MIIFRATCSHIVICLMWENHSISWIKPSLPGGGHLARADYRCHMRTYGRLRRSRRLVQVHRQRQTVHSLLHNVCNLKNGAGLGQLLCTEFNMFRRVTYVALLDFDAVVFLAVWTRQSPQSPAALGCCDVNIARSASAICILSSALWCA
jgi:hypothetical protein